MGKSKKRTKAMDLTNKERKDRPKKTLFKKIAYGSLVAVIALVLFFGAVAAYNAYSKKPAKNRLLAQAKIKGIHNNTLVLSSGKKVELPVDVESAFYSTEEIEESLKKNGAKYEKETEAKEYGDRIVIINEITTDKKPEIDDNAPENEAWPENETGPEENLTRPLFGKEAIDKAINDFFKKCKKNDPFCSLNKDDLKKLIKGNKSSLPDSLRGMKDKYQFKEQITIRKIPINKPLKEIFKEKILLKDPLKISLPKKVLEQKPVLEGGSFDFGNSGGGSFIGVLSDSLRLNMPATYNAIFINGFTYGYEVFYEKEWKWKKASKTIAKIYTSIYAGAGLGIRTPFKVSVTMPSTLNENEEKYNTTIEVKPIDASEQEMKEAGIKSYQLFRGKELVYEAIAALSAKAELLGVTILDETISKGFDNSRDFEPPMKNNNIDFGYLIVRGKDMGLYYGTEAIYIEPSFGLKPRIVGKEILLDLAPVNSELPFSEISFKNSLKKSFGAKAKSIGNKEDSTGKYNNFGMVLHDLKYKTALQFVFNLKIDCVIKDKTVFGTKRLGTPWIRLYAFEAPLPTLGRHKETTRELKADQNRKYTSPVSLDLNTTLIPIESGCDSLHSIASEGSEISAITDGTVNIIVGGVPLGSIIIHKGAIDRVSCGSIIENPDFEFNIRDFGVLISEGRKIKEGFPAYDVLMNGLRNKTMRIKGNSLFTNIGIKIGTSPLAQPFMS